MQVVHQPDTGTRMDMHAQRPKAKDVAALAGVSTTTVSFVMNDRVGANISPATRQRVLDAAAKLGYQPHASARNLAGGRSHIVGLVIQQTTEQIAGDALLAQTLKGLSTAAREARYQVLIEPVAGNGAYSDLLRSQRVDGIVMSGPRNDDAELAALAADGFPIVLQGHRADLDVPSVDVDNRTGAREAIAHLVGLGHRRIACVTNAPLVYTAAAERRDGYLDALRDAGIEFDPELLVEAEFVAASGHAAVARLVGRAAFTAIFVASDVVALGVLRALREAGLDVPGDVSVVGFDDVDLAEHFDPPLTTVRVPARQLGEVAGRTLLDRIAGQVVAPRTVLSTELIVRASTGPVRTTSAPAEGGTGT